MIERIVRIVREYPQWSQAERRNLDGIIVEVCDHMRNGTGNSFIASFVERVVKPELLKPYGKRRCPLCADDSFENQQTDHSVSAFSCERCELGYN